MALMLRSCSIAAHAPGRRRRPQGLFAPTGNVTVPTVTARPRDAMQQAKGRRCGGWDRPGRAHSPPNVPSPIATTLVWEPAMA
jgi:hypothetical protein